MLFKFYLRRLLWFIKNVVLELGTEKILTVAKANLHVIQKMAAKERREEAKRRIEFFFFLIYSRLEPKSEKNTR